MLKVIHPVLRAGLLHRRLGAVSVNTLVASQSQLLHLRGLHQCRGLLQKRSRGGEVIPKSDAQRAAEAKALLEKQMNSSNKIVRWGAIARSEKFQKGLTKWLVGAYGLFILYGGYLMKNLYSREKELEDLKKRADELNEFEKLRSKELDKNVVLRTREEYKLKVYQLLKDEYGVSDFSNITIRDYEPAKDVVERVTGRSLPDDDEILLKFNKQNPLPNILPPIDTTGFYESKATEYDSDIGMEEKAVFMGSKRKWLMKHCSGDVLEVSCGTGRNIPYTDMGKLNSITFLDSSRKMLDVTNEKFRKEYPHFKKVAFVEGKAEDLLALNSDSGVKYDTIVEAFGLCSHQDPIQSLQNFAKMLKPNGRIILLEHGRSDYKMVNRFLDERASKRLDTWGCRWNLDIGEILDDSGLEIVEESRHHFGTTWCFVCKVKGSSKLQEEIGFVEKYISSSFKNRASAFIEDEKAKQTEKTNKPPSSHPQSSDKI
ncbi:hypothetical protein ACO0RG_000750 [Hanseniaspora osmophila]|uniref:Methyltransferase OMS1, mitochondrial n=1 Tax=Hanseniaspora osmophila TaxID=56408 RepID=A0A1E5R2L4_9ASCO|nr:Methyltransferase OMS1, mitochondrial [Hanseniaspora osmophila]